MIAGAVPNAADSLTSLYSHGTQVVVGPMIARINDAAIIGYAVVLFPVLKRVNEGLALGYGAFRAVEATLLMVGAATLLSLIALGRTCLAAGAADAASFRASAEVALAQQCWAARLAALAYLVATPILTVLRYRSQLVPRFISVWGVVALVLLPTGLAIGVGDPTRGGLQARRLLVIPIILRELLFATWLLVRGFGPSAVAADRHVPHAVPSLMPVSN